MVVLILVMSHKIPLICHYSWDFFQAGPRHTTTFCRRASTSIRAGNCGAKLQVFSFEMILKTIGKTKKKLMTWSDFMTVLTAKLLRSMWGRFLHGVASGETFQSCHRFVDASHSNQRTPKMLKFAPQVCLKPSSSLPQSFQKKQVNKASLKLCSVP